MKRPCDACGKSYDAKTRRSKYCKRDECVRERNRRAKRPKASVLVLRSESPPTEDDSAGSTAAWVVEHLRSVDRLNTPQGRLAVAAAKKLDLCLHADTGSSWSAVSKRVEELLAAATADVAVSGDPVDELRAAREKRLRGA